MAVAIASLDMLEALERQLSAGRRRLHSEIDGLRTDIGLPTWLESASYGLTTGQSRELLAVA